MNLDKQLEKLKARMIKQRNAILWKLKPLKKSRELTNQEVVLNLSTYKSNGGCDLSDEELEKIHNGIAALTAAQSQVIFFRYFDGLTVRQIAGCMGLSKSEVHRILEKAISRLRNRLK